MKIAKNTIITIAIIFSIIYALNLEYFVKGVRVVYLNGYTTVYIDDYNHRTAQCPARELYKDSRIA